MSDSTTRRVAPALFVVALAIFVYFIDPTPPPLDVGFNANSALRIARGQMPYRDFFTLVTPLNFLLNAAIVATVGTSVYALNVVAALIVSTSYTLVFLIARAFMPTRWAVATWAIAMIFSPTIEGTQTAYSYTSAMFAFAAVLPVVRALRRPERRRTMVAAGVAIALSFWTKQTIGTYVSLALVAFFAIRWRHIATPRDAVAAAVGLVGASVPFVVWLAVHGAIGAFVQDCFLTPMRSFRAEARLPTPALSDLGWDVEGLEPLLYFVAIGSVLFTLGRLVRDGRRGTLDPSLLFLALATGCLLMITRERYSLHNLLSVTPPIFVLLIEPIARGWRAGGRSRWPAAVAVAGVAIFCAFGVRFARYRWQYIKSPDYERRVAFARDVFREHAGARIVVVPCAPLYYFVTGASNPTRYDLLIPGNLSPADRAEFTRDLTTRVDVVLFDEFWRFDRTPFADYNRAIYETLLRDFAPVRTGPDGQIVYARRRGSTPPREQPSP